MTCYSADRDGMAQVDRDSTSCFKLNKLLNLLSRAMSYVFPKRIGSFKLYSDCLTGTNGLEIGGPSNIFKGTGLIPVYRVIGNLDGCNFNENTVWEGHITEGQEKYLYQRGKRKGYQYVKDAVDLSGIGNEQYDFLLSSHAVEHIANPLKAISEWLRVLKTGGVLLMVVPHKDGTFDHKRPVTQLQHLIDDFDRSTAEDDRTHFDEIMELHDLRLDPAAGDMTSFRRRSMKNYENRCLHHHVFDTNLVIQTVDYFKLQILDIQLGLPYHIVVLARKTSSYEDVSNSLFLSSAANYKNHSPFPTDRNAGEQT